MPLQYKIPFDCQYAITSKSLDLEKYRQKPLIISTITWHLKTLYDIEDVRAVTD